MEVATTSLQSMLSLFHGVCTELLNLKGTTEQVCQFYCASKKRRDKPIFTMHFTQFQRTTPTDLTFLSLCNYNDYLACNLSFPMTYYLITITNLGGK